MRSDPAGTITEEGRQRVVNIDGYWIDFVPEGVVLLFNNHDRPGKGIGKVGASRRGGTNIANSCPGRKTAALAVGALQIDNNDVPDSVIEAFRKDADLIWAVKVNFWFHHEADRSDMHRREPGTARGASRARWTFPERRETAPRP